MRIDVPLLVSILLMSPFAASADPITIGNLSSNDDGSTIVIIDTLNDLEWLRWDVIPHLNYEDTVTFAEANGWSIAGLAEVQMFVDAMFGADTCDTTDNTGQQCGSNPGVGFQRLTGDNNGPLDDYVWFLSDNQRFEEVGFLWSIGDYSPDPAFDPYSMVLFTDNTSIAGSDVIGADFSWLLYRGPTCVPTFFLNCPGSSGDPQSFVNECTAQVNGGTSNGCSPESLSWDWGDGTVDTGRFFPVPHNYSLDGNYTLTVTNGTDVRQCPIVVTSCTEPPISVEPAGILTADQAAQLLADDGVVNDFFGGSVAVSGNTAVISAQGNDEVALGAGAAYVFVYTGSGWSQQAKLLADDGAANVLMSQAVALSGDTILAGATGDDTKGDNAGAVYVFVRNGTTWSQQEKLLAFDGQFTDYFGAQVAIDGDTALIGATGDDDLGSFSGSAYVFVRDGTNWALQDKLIALDGAAEDLFGGSSVAVHGDTAIVGAARDDDQGDGSGSAYVFVRNGTDWTQQAKLLPDDGAAGDSFGSVDVHGDFAIVSAARDSDNGPDSGSAYVFVRNGTSWSQQDKLLPANGATGDFFGGSVSIEDGVAIVGASRDDGTGSAYVFLRNGTDWIQQTRLLADDGEGGDRFGTSVSLSGSTAVVGAIFGGNPTAGTGSAYAFDLKRLNFVCLPDISGNSMPEVAVGLPGSVNVNTRDGSTDALINDIPFGNDAAIQIIALPDIDASGDPEIAVLNQQDSGQVRVQIRDSGTGDIVSNLWYGLQYEPVSMTVVPDYSGNGFPEIAVLGSEQGTDAVRVQLRDSSSNAFVDNVFLGTQSVARDVVTISDTSGNGIPEMGILGVLKANDHVRMQVWDTDTAAFQTNIWFGNVYQPQSTIVMPDINSNGSDEVVAMGVDPVTLNIRVQVRDTETAATHYNIWLGNGNEAIDVALINDINSNGFADLAILLKTPDGTGRVRVQDGGDGTFIRNLFFSVIESPLGLAVLPDFDGNGFDELAALGTISGIQHVQILDTDTGAQVNRIWFP